MAYKDYTRTEFIKKFGKSKKHFDVYKKYDYTNHEKKSLESVFDKTYKIISNDKFIKVLRDSKFRVNCGIKSLNN